MDNQRYLNVEMKVMFNIPVREDFDIDEFSEEELEDIAKQENTELVCAFCKEKYHFSQKEITDLLDNLK